jgi:hypothetical protein
MANREREDREKHRLPTGNSYFDNGYFNNIGNIPRFYSTEPPADQIQEEFSGGKDPSPPSESRAKLEILVTLITSSIAVAGAVSILWGLATLSYFSSFPQFETLRIEAIEIAVFGVILLLSFGLITVARVQRIRIQRALNKQNTQGILPTEKD